MQSMTNIPIERVDDTLAQIRGLAALGAGLVRLAVRSLDGVPYLEKILRASPVPLSADIHFDHRIAVAAIRAGVHKVRINPGNIGSEAGVREVVAAARDAGVPVRIGVNGGSLDRKKYPEPTPGNLAASAMDHVRILEDNGFSDIVVSIKSSDIGRTIAANELFAGMRDYPIHIGLTEAGYGLDCAVNSAVAIGHLLLSGIGDTIRVSMTGDPLEEIPVARKILEAAGLRGRVIRIIACPTCGRTDPSLDIQDLARRADAELARRYEKRLAESGRSVTVAVMGCEVNGPGEAREADAGLAGIRDGELLLFVKGEKKGIVPAGGAVDALCDEVGKLL